MNEHALSTHELRNLQGGVYLPKPGQYPGLDPRLIWPGNIIPGLKANLITRPYITD